MRKSRSIFHLLLLFTTFSFVFLILVSNRGGFIDYATAPADVCMSSTSLSSQNLRVSNKNTVNHSFIHFLNKKRVSRTRIHSTRVRRCKRVRKFQPIRKSIVGLKSGNTNKQYCLANTTTVRMSPLFVEKSSKEANSIEKLRTNSKANMIHSLLVVYINFLRIFSSNEYIYRWITW